MQAITVSNDCYPVSTAEDASLLRLKNDVLVQELDTCEAENLRLRKLIAKERRMRYQAYEAARIAETTEPCVDAFQRVMSFAYGVIFAFVVFMILLAVM